MDITTHDHNNPGSRRYARLEQKIRELFVDALDLLEQEQTSVRGILDQNMAVMTVSLRTAFDSNEPGPVLSPSQKMYREAMRSLVQVASAAQLLMSKMVEIQDDLSHVAHLKNARDIWAKTHLKNLPIDSIVNPFSWQDVANLPLYLAGQDQEAAALSRILNRFRKMDKLISAMKPVAAFCLSRTPSHMREHELASDVFYQFNYMGPRFRGWFFSELERNFITAPSPGAQAVQGRP